MDLPITVIGLTGQTGAGKSTVTKELEKLGCFIVDCDIVAREIVEKGSPVLKKLSEYFGEDIINPDGSLDRRLMAARGFADEESRNKLNSVTHPAITKKTLEYINSAAKDGASVAVIDAALLLESELKNYCDIVVSVIAPPEVRIERIIKRDGITAEQAMERMNAQKDEKYYIENSDMIIRNYPSLKLKDQMKELTSYIKSQKKKWLS
ncbi:MAG: dephospho-CoA kinase [Clostridiales bacterium]|nr:dephospho-CoA kinase [Clostridiales bacterium]